MHFFVCFVLYYYLFIENREMLMEREIKKSSSPRFTCQTVTIKDTSQSNSMSHLDCSNPGTWASTFQLFTEPESEAVAFRYGTEVCQVAAWPAVSPHLLLIHCFEEQFCTWKHWWSAPSKVPTLAIWPKAIPHGFPDAISLRAYTSAMIDETSGEQQGGR